MNSDLRVVLTALGFLLGFASLVVGVRLMMAAPHGRELEGVVGFFGIFFGVALLTVTSRRRDAAVPRRV